VEIQDVSLGQEDENDWSRKPKKGSEEQSTTGLVSWF